MTILNMKHFDDYFKILHRAIRLLQLLPQIIETTLIGS